jgi:hypothetical protein
MKIPLLKKNVFFETTCKEMSAPAPVLLTYTVATSLAGGELFSGIILTLSTLTIASHGLGNSLLKDKERQKILTLICFIGGITTMLSNSFNATGISVPVSDATVFIGFVCVQFGLVILNHNTVVRLSNLLPQSLKITRKTIDMMCCVMYILPVFTLIPIYLAFKDKAGTGLRMNTSVWNQQVYKPLNIGLTVATEVLATVTDVLLMNKVLSTKKQLASNVSEKKVDQSKKDLQMNYVAVWIFTLLDIALKIIIMSGQAFLFDTNIALSALIMRARTNLAYGLEMQSVFKQGSSSTSGSQRESTTKSTV